MKAAWFAAAIAALLIANPAPAQSPSGSESSPQAQALAQRYMAATGGTYELIQQQAYAAAGGMIDLTASQARQRSLQDAADQHRAELAALDLELASLMARIFTEAELRVAVDFLESPAGRSIADKKHVYFAAPFARDRPALIFTAEESAALAAYGRTPEAISMIAKAPALLGQTLALSAPVQQAIRQSALRIYCHASVRCIDGDDTIDRRGGPTLRE